MKRFRLWLIPELERLPTEYQRNLVYRRAISSGMLQIWILACAALGCIGPCLLGMSSAHLRRTLRNTDTLILPVAWMLLMVALFSIGFLIARPGMRYRARTALRKLGHRSCVPCGYDLTGNTSGTCPECGSGDYPGAD